MFSRSVCTSLYLKDLCALMGDYQVAWSSSDREHRRGYGFCFLMYRRIYTRVWSVVSVLSILRLAGSLLSAM